MKVKQELNFKILYNRYSNKEKENIMLLVKKISNAPLKGVALKEDLARIYIFTSNSYTIAYTIDEYLTLLGIYKGDY